MNTGNQNTQIAHAWSQHRDGHYDAAIRDFKQILQSDNSNLDAFYGLGIAQAAAGDTTAAIANFQEALNILETARRDEDTQEDMDRYMMLKRMFNQRLTETQSNAGS